MFVDRIEAQERSTVHLHSLVWQSRPPSVGVGVPAPSTRATNGSSDEHASTRSAPLRADAAGYCTRGKPTPTMNRRGGKIKNTQKTTQEDLA